MKTNLSYQLINFVMIKMKNILTNFQYLNIIMTHLSIVKITFNHLHLYKMDKG